jgi:BlaI family transcriptional regulator, penicillinase repressor
MVVVDRIPSERELDILKVLWRIGEARVRDVHQALCPDGECAFTTVQTLLRIMHDKGFVKRRSVDRSDLYKPVYTIEEATSQFLNKIYDGAVDKCVLSMLSSEEVSTDEMRIIEKMIAKARKTKESNEE